MKHRDWLRLNKEGEHICAALRQQGYQCCKQTRRLSWRVSKEDTSYLLTWLPTPVGDWNLLPNDTTPAREQMWTLVQSALAPKPQEVATPNPVQQLEAFIRSRDLEPMAGRTPDSRPRAIGPHRRQPVWS